MLAAAGAFRFLGPPHLTVLAVTVAAPVGLSVLAAKARSPRLTGSIAAALAVMLVANEVVRWINGLATVDMPTFLANYLPLHVCGAAIFLTAVALVLRNQAAYEIAYFWGLAGTVQALVTPSVKSAFPSYEFVRYFVAHGGIVTGVLFATWAMKMRPRRRSILRTIVITHVFAGVIAAADLLLGANYMFLCRPADAPTFFFFLPWPWYIPFLDAVGIGFIILLYLPFPAAELLRRRWAKSRGRTIAETRRGS